MTQLQCLHSLHLAQEPELSGPGACSKQVQGREAGQVAEGRCVSWSMAKIHACENDHQISFTQNTSSHAPTRSLCVAKLMANTCFILSGNTSDNSNLTANLNGLDGHAFLGSKVMLSCGWTSVWCHTQDVLGVLCNAKGRTRKSEVLQVGQGGQEIESMFGSFRVAREVQVLQLGH